MSGGDMCPGDGLDGLLWWRRAERKGGVGRCVGGGD
jgi:hypothetical protein